jgi:heat shock protein HslJ
MTDQTRSTLDRLMKDVPMGPAPIDTLLAAGRAAKRRKRRALVAGAAAATALVLGGGAMATQALTGAGDNTERQIATDPSLTPAEVSTGDTEPPSGTLDGTWTVQALVGPDGDPVLPAAYRGKVQLTFADGEVTGTTGCNDIFGSYQHDGEDLRFPPAELGTTLVDCNNEPPLLQRLEDVRHISTGEDPESISLHADNWKIVAVLERQWVNTQAETEAGLPCATSRQTAVDLDVSGPGRSTPEQAVTPFAGGLSVVVARQRADTATVHAMNADGGVARVFTVTRHPDGWWPDGYTECSP